jgi:hypothetical protein
MLDQSHDHVHTGAGLRIRPSFKGWVWLGVAAFCAVSWGLTFWAVSLLM